MEIMKSIRKMYSEIKNYSGNFGDPIVEYVDFSPLDYIDIKFPTEVRVGAAVGLIVEFCSHADNATFSDAQKGKYSSSIVFVLSQNCYKDFPEISKALESTQTTEEKLNESLASIYKLYIKNS